MSTASKSPRMVAAVALDVGKRTLPDYASRYSRKDFTLPQLFAILVLRKFFRTDYRGVRALLADWPELCERLGLKKVPHFTTLQKAEHKLLGEDAIRRMLTRTVAQFHDHDPRPRNSSGRPRKHPHRKASRRGKRPTPAEEVEVAAADSTGFETDRASRYFVRRRSRGRGRDAWQTTTYRDFAKLSVVCDCATHLILATKAGKGPRPDVDELPALLGGFCGNAVPKRLLADAGFDSEANHVLLREHLGVESVIPAAIGRPTQRLPTGRWRCLMATDFDEEAYGQRWQVETVAFMLKRHQGAALTARKPDSRDRELGLIAVTHNIMIVHEPQGFLQGRSDMKQERHEPRQDEWAR